ncbi:MAG TPA: FAD-dependent oxidoreductase, partial [Thermoleophilaceae bacterium]
GGAQLIPLRMAEQLGKRVVLKAPVRRIVQKGNRVRVESDRLSLTARQAIVAVPPSVGARIEYAPALPPLRAELVQRYPQGSTATFSAIYEKPFWREKGYSGRVGSDTDPVFLCIDNSPIDAGTGILTGTTDGARARRLPRKSAAERRQAALENFAVFFGDEALKPMMFLERNWSVPQWTRGCPGFLPPGVLMEHGPAIRAPAGRVHWASTEHSTSWNTFMEGAVRRGEAVAREVLAAL